MQVNLHRILRVSTDVSDVQSLSDLVETSPSGVASLGPLKVLVYHVGPLDDKFKRGIFFAESGESAEHYVTFHAGHEVKPYIVTAKKALIAPNLHELWMHFFKKRLSIHDIDLNMKFHSQVKAGRYADVQIARKVRGSGHDVYIYTNPAPPAVHELAVLKKTTRIDPVQE